LVAVSNRLPLERGRTGWRPTAGGLVSALRPALETRGGAWVGWDGGASGLPRRVEGLEVELCPLELDRATVAGYYHGFSNRMLWPLLHGLVEQSLLERRWWPAYSSANERFAAAALAQVRRRGDALLWVHDYHLMLVPALLRRGASDSPIGFFLHTPFPAPELFARLPWREQLIDGLLSADVITFHTEEYRDNFARTCLRLRRDVNYEQGRLRLPDGRTVVTAAHPISIDAAALATDARTPAVARSVAALRRQFAGRRVLLGVDRLDYTKGILERLHAIELLLEQQPQLRRGLAVVQIAVPSRSEVREYRELRRQVEAEVGRINGRFTEPAADVPVHYLFRGVRHERLLAYYRLADVCLVTPIRDGMNLVAKEFVVAQDATDGTGVLVLSEFTGAAEELHEALPCNPFDIEGLAATIERALALDPEERRQRLAQMATTVHNNDVFAWAQQETSTLEQARPQRSARPAGVKGPRPTRSQRPREQSERGH
jgi:alpha,alpha-trehalose-phosphate synthase [UDP-forming]